MRHSSPVSMADTSRDSDGHRNSPSEVHLATSLSEVTAVHVLHCYPRQWFAAEIYHVDDVIVTIQFLPGLCFV
jgi:hypothetical protein